MENELLSVTASDDILWGKYIRGEFGATLTDKEIKYIRMIRAHNKPENKHCFEAPYT